MSFDMDVSNAQVGVNTNLYTISPEGPIQNSGYCDIQENGSPQCMEVSQCVARGACGAWPVWRVAA